MPSSPAGLDVTSRTRTVVVLAALTILVLIAGYLWSGRNDVDAVEATGGSGAGSNAEAEAGTASSALGSTDAGSIAPANTGGGGTATAAQDEGAPTVTGAPPPSREQGSVQAPIVDEVAATCTAGLSNRELAGQTVWVMVDHAQLATLVDAVRGGDISGVVVMGTPTNAARLRSDISSLVSVAPRGLMVTVDEEGGRVQRLSSVIGPLPAAAVQASGTEADIREAWRRHGLAMASLGFTGDFAPVLDIGGGPAIGDRSWGDDAAVVSAKAGAAAGGLVDAGLLPTFKHFPGHGRASADTHDSLASTPPLPELLASDLVPYRNHLGSADASVMMGHLVVPGLTGPAEPASLSPAAYSLLRNEFGFDGVAVTDALNMGAVPLAPKQAAVKAVSAGADVALVPSFDGVGAAKSIASAVNSGALPLTRLQTAAGRVLRLNGAC